MTSRNSDTEPGQPCDMSSGVASGLSERAWMKCTCWPSISVRKCGHRLKRSSCARQSKVVRQYSQSSCRYARSVPYSQPEPGIWSGQRVRARRSRRSSRTASGTSMRNGWISSLPIAENYCGGADGGGGASPGGGNRDGGYCGGCGCAGGYCGGGYPCGVPCGAFGGAAGGAYG